jgi:hypothetical protein
MNRCAISGEIDMRWLTGIAYVAVATLGTVSAFAVPAVAIMAWGVAACRVARADEAKTGSFETTFTERSPLSEIKALTKRLKALGPGEKVESLTDYDLSKEGWFVYVPEKYDPANPMGLIVLALYKHADSLPPAILPQLADANVALVVPKEYLDAWWKRAGLMLDAAYNMEKQYKIDPKRVYIFGSQDWADADGKMYAVGNTVGLFYPEVFTGTFTASHPLLYRPMRTAGNMIYPQELPRLEMAQGLLARTHPFVVGLPVDSDATKADMAEYKADGFKYLKSIPVSTEQYHYPNFTTDWLPDVLKYMDAATADLKLPADNGK